MPLLVLFAPPSILIPFFPNAPLYRFDSLSSLVTARPLYLPPHTYHPLLLLWLQNLSNYSLEFSEFYLFVYIFKKNKWFCIKIGLDLHKGDGNGRSKQNSWYERNTLKSRRKVSTKGTEDEKKVDKQMGESLKPISIPSSYSSLTPIISTFQFPRQSPSPTVSFFFSFLFYLSNSFGWFLFSILSPSFLIFFILVQSLSYWESQQDIFCLWEEVVERIAGNISLLVLLSIIV